MGGCFLRLGFEPQKGVGGCRSCDAGSGRAKGVRRAPCLLAMPSPPGLLAGHSPGRLLSILKSMCTSTSLNIKSTFQSPVITYYVLIASPAL